MVTILCTVITACAVLFAYRMGLKDGLSKARDEPLKPIVRPLKPKPTKEQQKQDTLLVNIENYNGTAEGQVKI